ncbi:glycosyltransferase family 4 protein [Roseibium sp. HPY-6]|uniref:glycosyltransferase family 4 protein n=1 Tax=Roseibium sp. HPY-6 TaxID=3229852 RepID=UPI00338DE447
MKKLFFAYPGDLDTPTGGYGYDRQIIAGLRDLGWSVELISLGDGFPFPTQATLSTSRGMLARLPEGALLVVDGLAFGVMADIAASLTGHLELVALVHHPLCRETGLTQEQSKVLLESERKALSHANHVIVTSHATADQVADLFGISPDAISVILPGTEKHARTARSSSDKLRLLSVGTVVPRKGYDLLFAALEDLKQYDWHLDIVGGLDADPACHAALMSSLPQHGLKDRVTFQGAVAPGDLPGFYRSADIFVLASRYEGYGMAYTEALAHGLPVIGSGGGAVEDTLPQEAAIYCGIEDTGRLKSALKLLLSDATARHDIAQAAEKAAAALPDWRDAASRFAAALEGTLR